MAAPLTTTSHAILGLLAIKPWTTYELAQQMQRALGQFWPRAESKLYEEPEEAGGAWARARPHRRWSASGPGPSTRSRAKGRRALAAWVPTPGDGPIVEFEQLVKVFFAEHGTKEDLLATIASARAWSDQRFIDSMGIPQGYLDGTRVRSRSACRGCSSAGSS